MTTRQANKIISDMDGSCYLSGNCCDLNYNPRIFKARVTDTEMDFKSFDGWIKTHGEVVLIDGRSGSETII